MWNHRASLPLNSRIPSRVDSFRFVHSFRGENSILLSGKYVHIYGFNHVPRKLIFGIYRSYFVALCMRENIERRSHSINLSWRYCLFRDVERVLYVRLLRYLNELSLGFGDFTFSILKIFLLVFSQMIINRLGLHDVTESDWRISINLISNKIKKFYFTKWSFTRDILFSRIFLNHVFAHVYLEIEIWHSTV